jgi:hypothetical protein
LSDGDVEEIEDDTEKVSEIKTRQRQFLEERFSIIKPKTKDDAPAAPQKSKSTDFSLTENFRQDLMKLQEMPKT